MCGICVAHGLEKPASDRTRLIACSKKIRHRGPDWSGCYVGKQTVMVHERLAIVGVGASLLTQDSEWLLTPSVHWQSRAHSRW